MSDDLTGELERLRRMLAAAESALDVDTNFLVTPVDGVPYAQGTSLRLIGAASAILAIRGTSAAPSSIRRHS